MVDRPTSRISWRGLPRRVLHFLYCFVIGDATLYSRRAYSQEGEDLILHRVLENQNTGFYVDVGAHHPARFSNTYFFYLRGWSGINIDAAPGSMRKFARARRRDTNLEIAVGADTGRTLPFYVFNDPAISTFDKALAESRVGGPYNWRILRTVDVRTQTLREILASHLPPGRRIDFLTVDVEGFDLEVLRSNDWETYRPRVVVAECYGVDAAGLSDDPVHAFLAGQRYECFARTVNTSLFRDTLSADWPKF